ncbi:uncharacterized protein LOC133200968 [Saccostrea echinata]|uniref:uncharacterized protein LOC133200968 n=1 Tax=Saccostrea echinata TaxID=191078 RepID=UPI002A8321AE|nr:uncharacterized protein LOC133200968 [Saccostrea echinata]
MVHSLVLQTVFISYCYILIQILLCGNNASEIRSESSSRRGNLSNLLVKDRLLETRHGVESAIYCSILCLDSNPCVSFFYSPLSSECRLHSITLGKVSGAVTDIGSQYFVSQRGIGYIGDTCRNHSDCVTGNSECRSGHCWCGAGYSFNPRLKSCDANCSLGYSDQYMLYSRHFLHQNNRVEHVNVTLDQCRELCTSEAAFTCKTFEYGYLSEKCSLQEVTYLDVPGSWYEDKYYFEFDYYQRDCL